jgi:hypothetical protein
MPRLAGRKTHFRAVSENALLQLRIYNGASSRNKRPASQSLAEMPETLYS